LVMAGVGPGIGGATARYLAGRGHRLTLISRSDYGRTLAKEIGTDHVKCDLENQRDASFAVTIALEKMGGLDALIHTAGDSFTQRNAEEVTQEEFEWMISSNLRTLFNTLRAVVPVMKRQRRGSIITFSASPNVYMNLNAAYAAAKGGVFFLTKALAKELLAYNVRVNCIAPGFFAKANLNPQDRAEWLRVSGRYSPMQVAKTVEFLITNQLATGICVTVDGGWTLDIPSGL